ncbi:hypothetical protein EPUS_05156 [Endocarpon pusillum Z07020]|uniref:Peptidase M20 dimerisation domain-containing protein n=1 Tax=Endocarpon pusillum (strain Z07020 / HMAS-L-300199) TaxID=1263415 RepID=U1GRE3_ENDPU|nr:uncharacterized protein EPUS_05156 [Endocarpon pusillum Z07020]ERF74948.1 hypothetical protein EPUS_05156 [Endocarpon pusillum Z07020]
MAGIDQEPQANDLDPLHQHDVSSSSDDEDDDEDDDTLCVASDHDFRPGIDIGAIKSAKNVEHSVAHQVEAERSILALVVDDEYLFAGLEGGDIAVWSLETFEKVFTVHAHAESVLALFLSEDKQLLFSSGVDSVVNVWSAHNLTRLFSIYSHHDIGDVFCVAYSTCLNTLFCGSQNQSLQWFDLGSKNLTPHSATFPANRKHRFFDSLGPGGTVTPLPAGSHVVPTTGGQLVTFPRSNYQAYAHSSYVYCMLLAQGLRHHHAEMEVLVTGGGDGTIKIWSLYELETVGLVAIYKFRNNCSSVLSLTHDGTFLYAGLASGLVQVYNLDSQQLVQKINIGSDDVTTIQVMNRTAFCGTSNGHLKQFNSQFSEVGDWTANTGKILSSTRTRLHDQDILVTGGNDCVATFWDVSRSSNSSDKQLPYGNDEMVNSLRDFVAFRTVPGIPKYAGQCNEAATFLRKLFDLFNAKTALLSSSKGVNPILFAKFEASDTSRARKTVLFYGHYDVVDAEYTVDGNEKPDTDPFSLRPLNGYLYGRGVTDNKGPILAALYAVADLTQNQALNCDVTFLIEGEEEAGSRGFTKVVQENRSLIGEVDWILLSNSYWLDDHIPCLTYGMRGVVHARICISSGLPDRHSGMDGKSTLHEPLKDLTVLLSGLVGETGTKANIPGFYDHVAQLDRDEKKRYDAIISALMPGHPEIKDAIAFTDSLTQRWREPNLTIHRIMVPESKAAVTISSYAEADLSIRIVPNQDAETIATALTKYTSNLFHDLGSTNKLQVHISSKADAWLGDPNNEIFQILDQAITAVWNPASSTKSMPSTNASPSRTFRRPSTTTTTSSSPIKPTIPQSKTQTMHRPTNRRTSSLASTGLTYTPENMPKRPLYIREGGSIPVISFLEKEFNAPAAMFPCGQASDHAHLENERMRVQNLYNGREVFRRVFEGLPRD